jgi:hypothetical protein
VIWRALLFLALLGGGFAALHFALGSEAFTAPRTQTGIGAKPASDRPVTGAGIQVAPPKEGEKPVTFSVEGKLELQRTREVPLADGSRLLLPSYRLRAADSRPLPEGDNLMELRDVVVELYRLQRKVPAGAEPPNSTEPRAELAGELTSAKVIVEIERDDAGRPSLQEDREMDFFDAVFRTLPAAGLTEMRLTLARARLRTTATQARLRTEPAEPFTLVFGGDRPATMTGKGLLATMPTGDAPGPTDLRVLSEPQLAMDGGRTVIRSAGELHFVEEPSQSAQLTLEREVFLQSTLLEGKPPLVARGDRLRAGLRRSQRGEGSKPGALWHWLELTGQAVHVDAGEAQIDCVRVDVLPSGDGGAGLLTASGTPTTVTLSRPGEPPSVLTSQRRIHILPLTQTLQGYLGPYGLPMRRLAPAFAQAIVFSGESQIEMRQPQGLLRLTAAQGLVALRGEDALGTLSLRGRGAVTALIPGGGTLEGEDGFLLHDGPGSWPGRAGSAHQPRARRRRCASAALRVAARHRRRREPAPRGPRPLRDGADRPLDAAGRSAGDAHRPREPRRRRGRQPAAGHAAQRDDAGSDPARRRRGRPRRARQPVPDRRHAARRQGRRRRGADRQPRRPVVRAHRRAGAPAARGHWRTHRRARRPPAPR